MRGAQPDAECPRCGNLQPPAGRLATCLACGLVFPPHEIQRPVMRRARDRDQKLVGSPPPAPTSLLVREHADVVVYGWTDRANTGLAIACVGLVMAFVVWAARGVELGDRLATSLAFVTLVGLGASMMRRTPQLWLDRISLRGSFGTIALADIARIDADFAGRVLVEMRDGRNLVVASARDVRIADHLAWVVDARAQLSGPPHTGGGGTS